MPNQSQLFFPKDKYFVDLGTTFGFGGNDHVLVQGNDRFHKTALDSYASVVPGRQIFAGITKKF